MSLTANISVSLPFPWIDPVDERAEEKGYESRSEYIRSLVRADIEQDDETKVTLAKDGNGDMNETGAA